MKIQSITDEDRLLMSSSQLRDLQYVESVFSIIQKLIIDVIAFTHENFTPFYRIKWYCKQHDKTYTLSGIFTYKEAKRSISGGFDHVSFDSIEKEDKLWIERIK